MGSNITGSNEFLRQSFAAQEAAKVHEQLEEIQAQQRQMHYELEQRQHFQQCEPQPWVITRPWWAQPTDCE